MVSCYDVTSVRTGNERDAAELERLRRHNITYVLNVTAHVPQHWQAHGIRYKRIPASDSAQQNLKQYFEEAIEFIGKSGTLFILVISYVPLR